MSSLQLTADTPASSASRQTYLHLVEQAVTGSLFDELGACQANGAIMCSPATAVPFQAALRATGDDWPLVGHTMVGHRRLHNVRDLLFKIMSENIPGDFMELGVWRGGLCIYVKALFNAYSQERSVYVVDAFEALPGYGNSQAYLSVKEAEVRHNFEKYGLMDDRVVVVKGLFKDSVPKLVSEHPDMKIALLRLDSNFYDSHQDCFYNFYERLQIGGYLIMDDIRSHAAVQQAWADFKMDQGLEEEIFPIDNNGGYLQKLKNVAIDKSKLRPARDVNKV